MPINDIQSFSIVAASNSDIASSNIAENCSPAGINNALRSLGVMLRQAIANQGSDITAASTTNIAATGTSVYAKITGATPITSFGTPDGNPIRWIQWGAATPVTHNATSMILKGGVSKTYAAGGISCTVHEGSGNWRELYDSSLNSNGKHMWPVVAAGMRPDASAGPSSADVVATDVQYFAHNFDQTTAERVHFNFPMPKSWDEGTVTFVVNWTAGSGAGDVFWVLAAVARSEGDAIAATYSATATVTDTLTTANDHHRSAESSALTIDGSPAAGDTVYYRLTRGAANVADTLTADASLISIEIFFTTNEATDAA